MGAESYFAAVRELKRPAGIRLKKKTIERDWGKCRICFSEKDLTIHHIIPLRLIGDRSEIKYFNSEHNLVTLCFNCHASLHCGRIFYPEFLKPRCSVVALIRKCDASTIFVD